MKSELLTREQFRELSLKRDKAQCVVCGAKENLSVHHILNRNLFLDGGYYLNNGVTLCDPHHLEAEKTLIPCQKLRELAKITQKVFPEHLATDTDYDTWGNPILTNGMRLKGELFFEPQVQTILQPLMYLFLDKVKYSRTLHFPWSPGLQNDDRVMHPSILENLNKTTPEVMVSVKMDGENTTIYKDYVHARSTDYEPHPSRTWIKALQGRIGHLIPEGWRICGENLFAKHSIAYNNLPDYFMVFSIWNEKNLCLSWDETLEWTELLDLKTVPILYRGPWNQELIKGLYQSEFQENECEGYVVRLAKEFYYKSFQNSCWKFVRASHVQTDEHWMRQKVIPNKLKEVKL